MSTSIPIAQQERSRRTQERILDAAYSVLLDGGPGALTVGAIAERAGVGVGSVYRRFGDKDRLLLAIQATFAENLRDEMARRLDPALAPPALESRRLIAHAVRATIGPIRSHASLLGVFLRLSASIPEVHDVGFRAVMDAEERFEELLGPIVTAHPDRRAAIAFAYRLIDSTICYRLLHTRGSEADLIDWDDLRTRLTDVVIGYLLSPAPSSEA
jgi:AcrR family transcriptional regulator